MYIFKFPTQNNRDSPKTATFTDFGFKHIFGREMDKDVLIEFLNDLLEEYIGLSFEEIESLE